MQAGLRPKPPPPPITPAECKAYLADQCTPNPTSWNRLAMYNIPGGGEHVTPRGFTDYTAEFLLTRGPYAMLGYSWCGCTNGTCTFLAIARSAAITYHAPCAGGFFLGGFWAAGGSLLVPRLLPSPPPRAYRCHRVDVGPEQRLLPGEQMRPRAKEWDDDFGVPSNDGAACKETAAGSGVFERAWSLATVQWDCNTGHGTIARK